MCYLTNETVEAWRKANPIVICERHRAFLSEFSCRRYAATHPDRCEGCERAGRAQKRRCSVEGCRGEHYAKGKCRRHYQQRIDAKRRQKAKGLVCTVEGCNRERKAKGLCARHYYRQRKGIRS